MQQSSTETETKVQRALRLLAHCWTDPDASEDVIARYRTTQFRTILKKLPLHFLSTIFTAGIIAFMFRHQKNHTVLTVWFSILCVLSLKTLIMWWLYKTRFKDRAISPFATHLLAGTLTCTAFMYGIMFILIFDSSGTTEHMMLSAVIAGLLGSGAWQFSILPKAGVGWVLGLGVTVLTGLSVFSPGQYNMLTLLLGIYSIVLVTSVLQTSHQYIDALKAHTKIEDQRQVVDLLLHDFETNASDWLWETDATGNLQHASVRLANVLGQPAEELQGRFLVRAIAPFSSHYTKKHLNMFRALEVHLSQEVAFSNLIIPSLINTQMYWWSLTAKPLYTPTGEFMGWRGVGSDITEVRQRDERLAQQNHELLQEMKKAEAANAAKSEFLANMSHELRTPMNGIMGFAELLVAANLPDQYKTFAEIIHKSGASLTMLLNDILDVSKIEAGTLSVKTAPFQTRKTIENCIAPFEDFANKKNIELSLHIDSELPNALEGSAIHINKVLTNIIGNAIKFTPQGSVRVHVSGDASGEAQETDIALRITVTDTGIGIPADKMEAVFQKFTQVESSTTRDYSGTGLGLAICRGLTHAMGGTINVESEIGKGSIFTIALSLPIAKDQRTQERRTAGENTGGRRVTQRRIENTLALTPTLNGLNIMVASHIAQNREHLSQHIQKWGANPLVIETAQQGLAHLIETAQHGGPAPFILIDHQKSSKISDEDWYNFAWQIRNNPNIATTPILVLASSDDPQTEQSFLGLKHVTYVKPPLRLSAVLDALTNMHVSALRGVSPKTAHAASISTPQTKPKILVAEDNHINQCLMKELIDQTQYEIIFANHGQAACDAFQKHDIDLIFMDISMPVMNGIEATEKIRELEKSAGATATPIIALTAHAMSEDKQRFLEAGMDDYSTKPVNAKSIKKLIEKWHTPNTKADAA